MKVVTFKLDRKMLDELRRYAEERGISVGKAVRDAIADLLHSYSDRKRAIGAIGMDQVIYFCPSCQQYSSNLYPELRCPHCSSEVLLTGRERIFAPVV